MHEFVKERTAEVPILSIYCSCIKYIRSIGVNVPYGTNAEDIPNQGSPTLGGLILLEYEDISHVAIIQEFTDKGFLVTEANYKSCERTTRIISYNDPFIRGFNDGSFNTSDVESENKIRN